MVSYTRDLNSYDERAATSKPGLPWFALLLLFAVPLVARLYLLYIPIPLNIDEAQWTVSARSVLTDPIIWRSTDMQTSGPLNALAISWPVLFGLTPSILTSRLTGLVLQSLTILGMASLIRRGEALSAGTAALLATAVALTLAGNPDFIHYSSELVSLALIVLFCVVYVRLPIEAPAGLGLALCGLIASCLPFAKLQSAPFFMLFHALCLARLVMDIRARRGVRAELLLYIFASSLPVLVLVAPLFAVGEQDAFLTGYLGLGAGYAAARTLRIFPDLMRLVILMGGLTVFLLVRYSDSVQRRRCRDDLLLLGLTLWPTTLLTMWLPGRYFPHYELYGLVCLPLAVIVLQYGLPPKQYSWPSATWQTVALFAVALAASVPIHHNLAATLEQARMYAAFAPKGADLRPLFAWTGATADDALLMWGWEPELTAYAGLRSADRASIGEYLIRPNNGRTYFRDRLLKDLPRTNPAIVIDAAREGYFFNNDPNYKPEAATLQSFPELYATVSEDYEQVAGDERCAAIYLRRDKAAALRAAEIPLQSSAPVLVTSAGTEKCGDWWAPEPPNATAELTVAPAQPLAELWILASGGGAGDYLVWINHGTTQARIRFISASGAQSEKVVRLHHYPDWTVVAPPDGGPIARIEIESLDFVGKGPAIAAVKAFRKEW